MFGAIWVYAINLLNTLGQLEEKAYQHANRSEELRSLEGYYMDGSNIHDTGHLPGRKQAVKYLHIIALGVPDDKLPGDPLGRGQEALHIMMVLSNADPFTPMASRKNRRNFVR
jgi:hypothetical protein